MQPRVSKLEVILANVNGDDRDSLKAILEGTPWVLIDTELPQIEKVVRDASVPIVLCDRGDSDCWRRMMRSLVKARRDVCVILLAGATDAPGSSEVVACGAFDILTRPLKKAHVLPMLLFAYTYCRGHGPYLSRRRVAEKP